MWPRLCALVALPKYILFAEILKFDSYWWVVSKSLFWVGGTKLPCSSAWSVRFHRHFHPFQPVERPSTSPHVATSLCYMLVRGFGPKVENKTRILCRCPKSGQVQMVCIGQLKCWPCCIILSLHTGFQGEKKQPADFLAEVRFLSSESCFSFSNQIVTLHMTGS